MSSAGYYGLMQTQEDARQTYNYILRKLVPILIEKYSMSALAESVRKNASSRLRGLSLDEKQSLRPVLKDELGELLKESSRAYAVRSAARGNPVPTDYTDDKIRNIGAEESSVYEILTWLK